MSSTIFFRNLDILVDQDSSLEFKLKKFNLEMLELSPSTDISPSTGKHIS